MIKNFRFKSCLKAVTFFIKFCNLTSKEQIAKNDGIKKYELIENVNISS